MTPEENHGRKIVLVMIAGALIVSAVIIGAYVAILGPRRLPVQAVRFLLTIGLMWWLSDGSPVSKWLAVICFGLGGLAGLTSLLFDHRLAATVGVKIGTLYLSFAWTLITSADANAFLQYQRKARDIPRL